MYSSFPAATVAIAEFEAAIAAWGPGRMTGAAHGTGLGAGARVNTSYDHLATLTVVP